MLLFRILNETLRMAANPWHVIERLYDSDISAGLQTDGDGGATVWIGVSRPQAFAWETFLRGEFEQIAGWLDTNARRLFPDTPYAQTPPGFLDENGPRLDP